MRYLMRDLILNGYNKLMMIIVFCGEVLVRWDCISLVIIFESKP